MGQQIDPEDTIVVDTSSLKHWRPTAKRGKRKGRKRKHHETSGDSNEIPDSQDAMAGSETSSPQKMSPSKQSPAKKKPRGRPSRASQVSQQESEVEPSFEGSVVERGAEIEIEKSFAKETQED